MGPLRFAMAICHVDLFINRQEAGSLGKIAGIKTTTCFAPENDPGSTAFVFQVIPSINQNMKS